MRIILFVLTLSIAICSFAEDGLIAKFEVNSGNYKRTDCVVNIVLENGLLYQNDNLQLYEIRGDNLKAVDYQIIFDKHMQLWWVLEGNTNPNTIRYYELRKSTGAKQLKQKSSIRNNEEYYVLFNEYRPVLHYNHTMSKLPHGVDPAFSKSGYIHPLFAPSGKIISQIQPPDHIHHYGIWNAWTQTIFRKQIVDFWNLGQKQGKIDYAGTISTIQGSIFQSISTLHQHIAIDSINKQSIALNEELEIIVYQTKNNTNIIDYVSSFNCADREGIFLMEHRYGGFAFRGHESWNANTVYMLTSEGRDQNTADGERARWCIISEKGETASGILILSHPGNFNHPEPLRTWDSDSNNGYNNIFLNFSPIRNTSWQMNYGENYHLQYRIITFNGQWTQDNAERAWQDYAYPPAVKIIEYNY